MMDETHPADSGNPIAGSLPGTPHVERTFWPEAHKARLLELVAEGHSAGSAARVLASETGVKRSRNACIGLINRMGLAFQSRGRANQYPQVPAQAAVPMNNGAHVPSAAPFNGITLFELHARGCHFPINNGPPFLYCGAPKNGSSAYCLTHHQVVFVPVRK
jgi:hypothetical protein